jgi:sulfite exporter TauE/SafE
LYFSAIGLGLAGAPHCTVMCSAPCAAVTAPGGLRPVLGFQLARMASYALAGGLAAASVNTLQAVGAVSPVFKPLWLLVHLGALLMGLWLLVHGRQPEWVERLGRPVPATGAAPAGWAPVRGPGRSLAAGALWVAWPCGLLQSAVLVAALADTAWSGAAVMATFAGVSGLGLLVGPWVWKRVAGSGGAGRLATAGVRLAGGMLAVASVWAMGRGKWSAVAAYCGL